MTATVCRWLSYRISKLPFQSVRTTFFVKKILGCATLGMTLAKCDEISDLQQLKPEGCSREECIKQACLVSVNSASTLLTTTSSVMLDVCKEYKESLCKILTLLEELLSVKGDSPCLWDEIIEARSQVNKAKASLTELSCYMDSVEKVVNSTTEAAFLAGADYMCTVLCERLYSAQREINDRIYELKKLEEEYNRIQREIICCKDEIKGRPKPKKVHVKTEQIC